METKKIFTNPVCEVVKLELADVIASSTVRTDWDTDAFAFDEE